MSTSFFYSSSFYMSSATSYSHPYDSGYVSSTPQILMDAKAIKLENEKLKLELQQMQSEMKKVKLTIEEEESKASETRRVVEL